MRPASIFLIIQLSNSREFFCMTQGDGEPDMTRMYIHKG